jgi:hypothetical protein
MAGALFCALTAADIAAAIGTARQSVCYAAPGVQPEPAAAMVDVAARLGPELITVCLDFDERVLRMGFGDLDAVKALQGAGIAVTSTPGLRTGLIIVDGAGWIFTPTALFLEPDNRASDAPNAMRLTGAQASEALARLSPAAKAIAIAMAKTEEEKTRIREQAVEVPSKPVEPKAVAAVAASLDAAPPARFDVARQVRVFNAYLQYVEMSLTGAAIQRRRLAIPPIIQKLGGAKDLEGRLRTTFDLIEKGGALSSKALDQQLAAIRNSFTPSLGKDHGRVLLKTAKPRFEQRIEELRAAVKTHQETVAAELQSKLDDSRKQIVDYYLPLAMAAPSDEMHGQLAQINEETVRAWLDRQLESCFPTADSLIQKMMLDVRYKDVTFETLNQDEFKELLVAAFPSVNWDKAYSEFRAAGEEAAG